MKRRKRLRFLILMLSSLCAYVFTESSCVKQPRRASFSLRNGAAAAPLESRVARIQINTARADELEKLPGIGKALAARIIAHREHYGRFRRAEHLLMVRGISDRRFREMRSMISVE